MVHYRQAATCFGALWFAALTLQCGSKTFDLLPEKSGGVAGQAQGGAANSTFGGSSGAGFGGRASGGRNSGGAFGAGAPSLGGFPTSTGGRPPQCETDDECTGTSFAKRCVQGRCVQCESETDCAGMGDAKRCVQNRCVQCEFETDCAGMGDAKHCDFRSGECVQCANGDSAQCDDPAHPYCGPNGTCFECTKPEHCRTPGFRVCDPELHACVGCTSNDDCTTQQQPFCEPHIHSCVRCYR